MKKVVILSIILGLSGVLNAGTIVKTSGATTPHLNDFSQGRLSYPYRASGYNDTHNDRIFFETFKIPKSCKVIRAKFSLYVQKNSSSLNNNDSFGIESNGQTLLSQRLWTNNPAHTRTVNMSLNNSILNAINNTKRFSFYVEDDTRVKKAVLSYACAGGEGGAKKGMTWRKISTNHTTGTTSVDCGYSNGHNECNPYHGDHLCTQKLPILCTLELHGKKPASVHVSNSRHAWSGNLVHTTRPVAPATEHITTLSKANAICVREFGKGWRVAEFHDARQWGFQAYGNTQGRRFWVNIKDQADGNCWSQH